MCVCVCVCERHTGESDSTARPPAATIKPGEMQADRLASGAKSSRALRESQEETHRQGGRRRKDGSRMDEHHPTGPVTDTATYEASVEEGKAARARTDGQAAALSQDVVSEQQFKKQLFMENSYHLTKMYVRACVRACVCGWVCG